MNDAASSLLQTASHLRENSVFDPEATPGLREELKGHWNSVWSKTIESKDGPRTVLCDSWFDKIFQQHNEKGRFYHTSVHLKEMLEYLEVLKQQCQVVTEDQASPMVWATFFHDVVYDPKSSRNEKDSAIMFQQFGENVSMNSELTSVVVTMIEATEKHHVIPMKDQPEMEEAQGLFLDLDMAVLGKTKAADLAYAGLIRHEYAFVEHQTYCSKRAEILQTFLHVTKSIYATEIFRTAMEAQARENLQSEISLLQKGIIPGDEKED